LVHAFKDGKFLPFTFCVLTGYVT